MVERLGDIPIGDSVTGCFYGPAGAGKTWCMGTAGDRTLYCNVEDRLGTFQTPHFRAKYKFNPYVITVNEEYLPEGGAKALDELANKANDFLEKQKDDVDFIIVDGATALRRFAMNKGLELNQKVNKSSTITKIKALPTAIPFIYTEVNDYVAEMNMIANFIERMKQFCKENHKHFFMTAHERIEFNKPAKIGDIPTVHSIKPGFTGQTFPDSIPGMFDLVWHFETKGAGDRILYQARTAGDSALIAKSSIGQFPVLVDNPNLLQIVEKIKNGK